MYWSTSDILHIPLYPSIMSHNRFSSILLFLHVSNNQMPRIASAKQDKLAKGAALDSSPRPEVSQPV